MKDHQRKRQSEQDRYMEAAHAMQSGVAHELQKDPATGTPKHMRTGINSAHVSVDAISQLLLAKGIITIEEYETAMADAMEREAARYEAMLSQLYGTDVKLG